MEDDAQILFWLILLSAIYMAVNLNNIEKQLKTIETKIELLNQRKND